MANYKSRTDGERIAVLENKSDNHESDVRDLNESIRSLTEEIHKTREVMLKKFSFMSGVALAFGSLAGICGAGITMLVGYFTKR